MLTKSGDDWRAIHIASTALDTSDDIAVDYIFSTTFAADTPALCFSSASCVFSSPPLTMSDSGFACRAPLASAGLTNLPHTASATWGLFSEKVGAYTASTS